MSLSLFDDQDNNDKQLFGLNFNQLYPQEMSTEDVYPELCVKIEPLKRKAGFHDFLAKKVEKHLEKHLNIPKFKNVTHIKTPLKNPIKSGDRNFWSLISNGIDVNIEPTPIPEKRFEIKHKGLNYFAIAKSFCMHNPCVWFERSQLSVVIEEKSYLRDMGVVLINKPNSQKKTLPYPTQDRNSQPNDDTFLMAKFTLANNKSAWYMIYWNKNLVNKSCPLEKHGMSCINRHECLNCKKMCVS